VISLIGESGSGKTTIGKVLLRLVQPTSGTVTFDGKDIASYSGRGLRDYYRQVQGEITHAEQVVKRDLRAVFGGGRAVASGKSQVAVALEPPVLHEFEPDHLVAEPE